MTDCIINGGAGEEAPAGEPFRVTYCTDKGEETTHLRILDVEDDSMEPEIREGDWVVVDPASRLPEASGTFLLRNGERLVARQVEAVRGDGADERPRLRLIPHTPCRAEDVHIRDKVLWVVRRVVRRHASATGRKCSPLMVRTSMPYARFQTVGDFQRM